MNCFSPVDVLLLALFVVWCPSKQAPCHWNGMINLTFDCFVGLQLSISKINPMALSTLSVFTTADSDRQ